MRKKISEETRSKLSLSKTGNKNPMYGKSGVLSPTWGIKRPDNVIRMKLLLTGRKQTPESNLKRSMTLKGRPSPNKGVKTPESVKQKLREASLRYLASGRAKNKDTSIELAIEKILKDKNVFYKKQLRFCNCVPDFYIPDFDLIINCDGDYWHSKEKVKIRDIRQDEVLINSGYKVFRFLGSEINKSPLDCIMKTGILDDTGEYRAKLT